MQGNTHIGNGIQAQIQSVSQLPPHGTVPQYRIRALAIHRYSGCLEVFDILAQSQCLASQPELLFDGFEGRNNASGAVCSEKVPCIESGEVL